MKVFKDINHWQVFRKSLEHDVKVGFVPTMGALHKGHLSLIRHSLEICDVTIASIYVNPTQFNNPNDLKTYPDTLADDIILLNEVGVDGLILPTYEQIYPDNFNFVLSEKQLSLKLCGAHRPGHFDGVLTVVLKLFNLVRPHSAFFGEKDFQQLQLIRSMVEALFLDIKVVGCPVVRESDGLAMSSRNLKLSSKSRQHAGQLYQILKNSENVQVAKEQLLDSGFQVEYVEDLYNRRLAAAILDNVRLIDNVEL